MRTQAIEELLKLIVEEVNTSYLPVSNKMRNYMAKAEIILNREDDRDESVIRELINK